MKVKTAAVFVHGLWLNGAEFTLLRRRLARDRGIEGHRFSYPTVRGSMEQAVAQLARFVERIDAERIHFIGHSFGGVVLCRYFQKHPCERPGRVVILGSPPAAQWLAPMAGPLFLLLTLQLWRLGVRRYMSSGS